MLLVCFSGCIWSFAGHFCFSLHKNKRLNVRFEQPNWILLIMTSLARAIFFVVVFSLKLGYRWRAAKLAVGRWQRRRRQRRVLGGERLRVFSCHRRCRRRNNWPHSDDGESPRLNAQSTLTAATRETFWQRRRRRASQTNDCERVDRPTSTTVAAAATVAVAADGDGGRTESKT